jgi:hypothetical protein
MARDTSSSNTSSSTALYTAVPPSGPQLRPRPLPPPYRGGRATGRGTGRAFQVQGPYPGSNHNRGRPGPSRSRRPITNSLIQHEQATSNSALGSHSGCRTCGQPGHIASNCPSMQCWECGEFGHGRSTCPLNGVPGTAEQERRGLEAYHRYQAAHPRTGQANLAQGNAPLYTAETSSQYPDSTPSYEETHYEDAY